VDLSGLRYHGPRLNRVRDEPRLQVALLYDHVGVAEGSLDVPVLERPGIAFVAVVLLVHQWSTVIEGTLEVSHRG
jgi:hypothetical protein